MDWLHIAFHRGLHLLGSMQSWIIIRQTIVTGARSFAWTEKSSESTMFIVQIPFFPTTGQQMCWAGAGRQFKQAPWLHFWAIVSTFRRQFVNHYSFLLCMQILFQGTEISKLGFSESPISARAALLKIKPQALYARTIQGKNPNPQNAWVGSFYRKNEEACVICSSTLLVPNPILE